MNAEGEGTISDVAKVVAAATALVTGVGALTITGTLGRVQRNHPIFFTIALGLVIFGAGAALISKRAGVLRVGAGLMILGVLVGFGTTVWTSTNTERPAVEVKLDDESLALTATGTVSNLGSADRIGMVIEGLTGPPDQYEVVRPLSWSYGGPNGEGDAKATLDVQVPPGRYDAIGVKAFTDDVMPCDYQDERVDGGTGCVVIPLPQRPDQPQITASWQGRGRSSSSVKVTMKIANAAAGGAESDVIWLKVIGLRGKRRVNIYHSVIAPPVGGAASRTVRVPLEPHIRFICAQASALRASERIPIATCPLRDVNPALASAELRVPRSLIEDD